MASNVVAAAAAGTAWILSLMGGVPTWLQSPLDGYGNTAYPSELAPLLSPAAKIHLPGSNGFELVTDRWNSWQNPHFDIVVEVATEADVSHTVPHSDTFMPLFQS